MLHQKSSRRSFLAKAGTVAAAIGLGGRFLMPQPAMSAVEQAPSDHPICIFVKFLQTLSFDELAETIASMNVAGIEATVRKGGQILPEHVEEQLPKLVEALRRRNLEVTIMTSNVSSVDQPLTEKVLRTAAGLGIKRYRMDYYRYDLKKPIQQQLQALQPVIKDLAALNREIGIQGVYQNHAGPAYVGAGIWDMQRLLEGIPKEEIALAYDIRHATVEGGTTWQTTWNLAQPHLGSVFVKDTKWQGRKLQDGALGLPDGVVDPRFYTLLKQSDPSIPISLHVEYLTKDPPNVQVTAIRENLKTLRELLAKA